MGWLSRWIRTTFDYNPAFPLSALALMAGLRMLAGEGGAASVDASGPLAGVGVISGYELCLLGAALLVLWPRRISYETTAILIIFSVVRFATPFLTIGLATDGHLGTAIGVGLCLTLLMAAKGEAISRRVGLKLHGWERLFDYGLFMLAAVAFPLLAERLSAWTGDAITLRSARLVQLASWWALTLVLLPLTRGISPESAQDAGPLQSRLPARVWRCVTSIGMVALLFGALWLAGDSPSLLAVLPLVLFAAALVGTLLVSGGGVTPAFFAHVPAAVVAVAAIVSSSLLMGRVRVLAHPVAVLALGGMAAFWLPLIVRDRAARVRGLRSLGYVAALVPLRFCHSLTSASVYAFALAVVVLAFGLTRRRDGATALSGVGVALIGGLGVAPSFGVPAAAVLFGLMAWGGVFAALVAVRIAKPEESSCSVAGRVATALCVLPCAIVVLADVPGLASVPCGALGAGGLALLGWRHERKILLGTGAVQATAVVGSRAIGVVNPGLALVLLAFAAIPMGTGIAIRRERRRELEAAEAARPVLERVAA